MRNWKLKYVAEYIGKKLKDNGDKVKIDSIDKNSKIDEDAGILIIGGPIYASNVLEKLIRWVLINVENKNTNYISVLNISRAYVLKSAHKII